MDFPMIFPWLSHDFPIESSRKILDFPALRASSAGVTAPSARCSPTNGHARSYPPPPWCDARDCCTSTAPEGKTKEHFPRHLKGMGLKDWYHNGRYIILCDQHEPKTWWLNFACVWKIPKVSILMKEYHVQTSPYCNKARFYGCVIIMERLIDLLSPGGGHVDRWTQIDSVHKFIGS